MTTATPKADRVYNRAPRGGMLCPITRKFFKGGQFCPLYTAEQLAAIAKPAPLAGSSRQVAWATRLRAELLKSAETRMADLVLGLESIRPAYRPMYRDEIRGLALECRKLMTTTSAVAIIEAR